jgi:hypothetical protein
VHNIVEWHQVDLDTFANEIVPADRPALIRSLVSDWPAVISSRESAAACCRYLQRMDNGSPVYTIAAPPEAGGRFFYTDDLKRVNFQRGQIPLAQVLAQLLDQSDEARTHSIAVQALDIRRTLPDFESENPTRLIDASVAPTMWIGNQGRVAPHFDVHRNLACVVAGRRRFVLFPPEQLANLYLGPVLDTPGGVPISLVDESDPDFDRFPRYKEALETAQEAVLEPGDAIYIPSLWWHGVTSLEQFNVLVNYWWGGITASRVSPNDSLLHGMLAIAGLDASQRQAWRDYFDYYVFRTGENPETHLPPDLEDLATSLGEEKTRRLKKVLAQRLENSS